MTDLSAIGWRWTPADLDPAWRALMQAHPQARPARIVEQHRSGYRVAEAPGQAFPAESLPQWQRAGSYRKGDIAPEERPAVGDWVLVQGASPDGLRMVALLPRFSAIKRGAAGEHYRQQVIAANIDTAFVVCGLDGDFNPRRIERYLLLVSGHGVQPVVVLTKADLAVDGTAAQQALHGLQVPHVMLDARSPDAAVALAPWLQPGQSVVLVGSSGAGKSTLTNTLLGQARMKTGAVRARDARGRHTTTHRALLALPSGACIIDTPGMRELKPTGEEDVSESFADIESLAEQCRFRDCLHDQEPGCAVRAAVASGALSEARLAHYRKLRQEVDAAARSRAEKVAARTGAVRSPGQGQHGRH